MELAWRLIAEVTTLCSWSTHSALGKPQFFICDVQVERVPQGAVPLAISSAECSVPSILLLVLTFLAHSYQSALMVLEPV